MIKLRKKLILLTALLISVTYSSVIVEAVTTVTGYKSINNSSDSSYKTSEKSIIDVVNSMNRPSDFNEILNYSANKKVINNNAELSYLIDNDILSYDVKINYNKSDFYNPITTSESSRFNFTSNNKVSKSDFLATLSKSVYGVEQSRGLIFSSKSIREVNSKNELLYITSSYKPKGYVGKDDTFDFSRGDYSIYLTPNVYELYFKRLINKGVVSLNEFSDINFINSIKSYNTTKGNKKVLPCWDSSLGYYNVSSPNYNSDFIVEGSSPFGKGFKLNEGTNNAVLDVNQHSWFLDEDLLTIEALEYIEKALRSSEKEMTKSEAELVNYKYGARYLDKIDDTSKDTVMFLVAKGVLNFENDGEFKNLYKELDCSFFRTLMYRVHNKNARFNFSSIQLTDNDNYWLSRGFYENKINLFQGVGASFDTNVSEYKPKTTSKEKSSLFNLFGLITSREYLIADGEKEFEVTRKFNNHLKYTYKGVTLEKGAKHDDIIDVSTEGTGSILVVKFKIKARSAPAAVAILDANMTVVESGITSIGSIPAISSVVNGKVTETFVSQTALRKMSGVPLLIMNDKYLVNKDNSCRALLLEDNKIAIVGNEIVRTDNTIVKGINGEVYYNLDIISKLLSQVMLSSLDPSNMYLLPSTSLERDYDVISSNGSSLEKLYVQKFEVDPLINGVDSKKVPRDFYNMTLTNSTGNYLIQNISEDIGSSSKNNYMLVEFSYALPDSSEMSINNNYLSDVIYGRITMGDVYSNLYKKPNNSSLASIWDSNLLMSNAIINYMMGTSRVNYIKSGFIIPKVTILCDNGKPGEVYDINKINKLFIDKIKIPSTLVNNYGSYDSSKPFVQNYFSYSGMDEISSKDAIIDNIKSRRTLEVIGYKKEVDKKAGFCDFSKFVVLGTGQIYRRLESNPNLVINKDGKIVLTSKSSTVPKILPGVSYTIDGNKSELKNFIVPKISNTGVADLLSLESLEFTYDKGRTSANKLIYKDGSGNIIEVEKYLDDLKNSFIKDYSSPVMNNNFSADIDFINPKDVGVYYSESKYYQIGSDGKRRELNEKNANDQDVLVNNKVKVYPRFRILASGYYPNSGNVLIKYNADRLVLDIGNLVNSGISSQIVDSIVYENSDYVTYSELPNNATVFVGDVSYKKTGDYLQSGVLNNSDVISELSSTDLLSKDGTTSIKTAVAKTIGNVSLYNRSITSNVKFGASEVPLSQYIVDTKLGSGLEGSDYNRTLKLNNKGQIVVNSFLSSDVYQQGSSFSSYCIAFKLDSSIRFRSIDESNTKFALIRVINKNSDGFLEDVPFFMESLDYEDIEGLNVDMLKSKFKPSDNAGELMEKFLDAYRWNTQRDLKELAKYWIRLICTVLSVNNLLIVMFRRSPLDVIVRDIKYSPSSKRNTDLYKIFTFGFQTVESHVPIWKGVLVSGVLIAIASFATIGSF